MGYSVTGIMLNNMYGTGLLGGDICGFIGDTTPELCARWHVLGSYYPFSRNHNNYGQISQEPYVFKGIRYEEDVDYMSIMKDAIFIKYSLNRYYYTELTGISMNGDHQFFKPLFYTYPDDILAFYNIPYNIMLGNSLKLAINSNTVG
jgi:alpha-glucosidase (family GH31 glycosyl hydrolase)